MNRTEFNNVEYNRLLGTGFKFIEIIATGEEVETSPDYFRKVINLIPHKKQPESKHYVIEIEDSEVVDMVEGTDTDIFYILRA